MRRFVAVLVFMALVAPVSSSATVPPDDGGATWILRFAAEPTVAYDGGFAGYPATSRTSPREARSAKAESRYETRLVAQHDRVVQQLGGHKVYDYTETLNAVAVVLTPAQAVNAQRHPEVVSATRDHLYRMSTDNSATFLGLDQPGGLWDQLGGVGAAGEDVVVGVIDTGIWPEHPSFSDQADLAFRPGPDGDATRVYDAPEQWYGTCESGEAFDVPMCSNKLIGARYFSEGTAEAYGIDDSDFLSPRDGEGHGSHVAGTAAGNVGVPADLAGQPIATIRGIAPRARVAAYKALWNAEGIGTSSDIAKAIDVAVSDGVDVINMSLAGGPDTFDDPVVISMLLATGAGVFVSKAASNEGPNPSTTPADSSVPWATIVGAGTQDRTFVAAVHLGDGAGSFTGGSARGGVGPVGLIAAEAAAAPGATAEEARRCDAGALDPDQAAGRIVLCARGLSYLADKAKAVEAAGGVGVVIHNLVEQEPDPDWSGSVESYVVPSVLVSSAEGDAMYAYLATVGPSATASIGPVTTSPSAGGHLATFSSRGPGRVTADLLTPSVVAPGQNILAANAPAPQAPAGEQLFQVLSGTSMATPHVAGLAALLVQLHPTWSPAMVKSALMTTATPAVTEIDGAATNAHQVGAGYARPNLAANPGIVFNATFDDYVAVLCGFIDCGPGTVPLAPAQLNEPSIALGELLGTRTVRRTMTNVSGATTTYSATVEGLSGLNVIVSPSTLTLRPGTSKSFNVTITRTSAAHGEDVFGSLVWKDATHTARLPVVVQPRCLRAGDIVGTGSSGTASQTLQVGCTGNLAADVHGLVPASATIGTVEQGPNQDIEADLTAGVGVTRHELVVPADTTLARMALSDDQVTPAGDDIDLFVFRSDDDDLTFDELVGQSGTFTSNEQIDLEDPEPGRYVVVTHGFVLALGEATYTLSTWLVPLASQGNATVTVPGVVVAGSRARAQIAWNGLLPGTSYLGLITYHVKAGPGDGPEALVGRSVLAVDTTG